MYKNLVEVENSCAYKSSDSSSPGHYGNYCLHKFSAIYHEVSHGIASIVSLKCLFKSFVII